MYDNPYNREVCNAISDITKKMINHENHVNSDGRNEHKITTRLEGMALRKKNIHGGTGYAAATLGDHGFKEDATLGAGACSERAAGMSAAGMSAAGVSAAGKHQAAAGKAVGCGV